MIFGTDRGELRQMYIAAWRRRLAGQVLSPLDSQIADVIEAHPEYHAELDGGDVDAEYTPEGGRSNPYLHMGLHLGIREQVATDRPAGIRAVYETLTRQTGDPHDAEHRMIDCLAETLWAAQANGSAPDESHYLEMLRRLPQ